MVYYSKYLNKSQEMGCLLNVLNSKRVWNVGYCVIIEGDIGRAGENVKNDKIGCLSLKNKKTVESYVTLNGFNNQFIKIIIR